MTRPIPCAFACAALVALGVVLAGPAQSQQGAGALLGDAASGLDLPRATSQPAATLPGPRRALPAPEPGAPAITVRMLAFSGAAELLGPADRAALSALVVGQRLDFQGLQALADAATERLQARGFILARATLPPQDVTEGRVELAILEGQLGQTHVIRSDSVRQSAARVQAILRHHIPGPRLEEGALETALLSLNDLPGIAARGSLRTGSAPGTADLVVELDQGPAVIVVPFADNHGSPNTGTAQAGILLRLDDLRGMGERVELDVAASRGARSLRLSADMPLGVAGTRVSVGGAVLRYRNTDPTGVAAGLKGTALQLSAGLDHPVIRTRRQDLSFGAILDHKRLRDDSAAGLLADKSVTTATGYVAARWRQDSGAETVAQAALALGRQDLSRLPAAVAADAAGPRSAGSFARLNLTVGHVQPLAPGLALSVGAQAQLASRNLDTSQKFVLGGPRGVRGWPVGEARGDSGLLVSSELRWQPEAWRGPGQIEVAALGDWGHVRLNQRPVGLSIPTATGRNSYGLASAGLALRWNMPTGSVEVIYARGLGRNPGRSAIDGSNADGGFGRSRVWLSGSMRF